MNINNSDLQIISKIFYNEDAPIPFITQANDKDEINAAFFLSDRKIEKPGYSELSLSFIANMDGTIRWMFPANGKKPLFLSLYNTSSFKGKIKKLGMGIAYSLGMKQFFTQQVFLYSRNESSQVITNQKDYAVFFGTRGVERKVVIATFENGKASAFLKIPFGERAKSLVNNEYRMLQKVKALNLRSVKIPLVFKWEGIVSVGNVRKNFSRSVQKIDKRHIAFLKELYAKTHSAEIVSKTSFFERVDKRIQNLNDEKDKLSSGQLVQLMKEVKNTIDKLSFAPLAYSHGDFTPWNTFVTPNKLQLYDWERSQEKTPMFYDLIHYVVQTGILVKRLQPKAIMEELKAIFSRKDVRKLVMKYNVSVDQVIKLYFLDQFSYLLSHYQTQKEALHPQSYWMCEAAKGLLESVHEPKGSYRQLFIKQFFEAISEQEYALMKFTEGSLSKIAESSDLDICVSKKVSKTLIEKIQNNTRVMKTKLNKKAFMSTLRVYFRDNSFISIDFIHRFERKTIQLLSTSEVMHHAGVTREGVKVPQPRIDFEYKLLFYQLNGASFPEKYQSYYRALPKGKQRSILFYLNSKYNLKLDTLDEYMTYDHELRAILMDELKWMKMNAAVRRFFRGVRYIIDTFHQLVSSKGMIITVSGVDGAGKSTFINGLKSELAEKFRNKVIVLRHRPSILPILSVYKYGKEKAHARATEMMPRTGSNKSKLASIVRFGYYYLDYLIGQFYIQVRYVRRGYLVIFDRYYFDFISDPKRTNLVIPKQLPKALYRFVLNPDINVLLYADPLMILERKQELSREDIVQLTKTYLDLFRSYSNKYRSSRFVTIENIDLERSLSKTIQEYIMAS